MKKIININIFLLIIYSLFFLLFAKNIYFFLGIINCIKFFLYSFILVLIDIKIYNLYKYQPPEKLPKRVSIGIYYNIINKIILIISEIIFLSNNINNFIYDTIIVYYWFSIIIILITILNYSYIYENKIICILYKNFYIKDIKEIYKCKNSFFGKKIYIKLNNKSNKQIYLSLKDYKNLLNNINRK